MGCVFNATHGAGSSEQGVPNGIGIWVGGTDDDFDVEVGVIEEFKGFGDLEGDIVWVGAAHGDQDVFGLFGDPAFEVFVFQEFPAEQDVAGAKE